MTTIIEEIEKPPSAPAEFCELARGQYFKFLGSLHGDPASTYLKIDDRGYVDIYTGERKWPTDKNVGSLLASRVQPCGVWIQWWKE